ncbi:hypothetical protein TYRP_018312 [Tyrophagus putrescentiae]|nr:hypothetical protein TYRP_018312 [Tyrophagus putrescentiae]
MFHLHLFTSTDHGSFVSAEDKGPRPPAPIASVNVSTPASVNVTLTCQMPPGYTIEKHRLKPFHMYFIFDYDDGVMGDIFATFTVDYDYIRDKFTRSFETDLDDNNKQFIASVEKVKFVKRTLFSIVVTAAGKAFRARFYCDAEFNDEWSDDSNVDFVIFTTSNITTL